MALKVGVTGGIGAGKSIICRIFSVLGVPIYDADQRAKAIMIENPTIVADIEKHFGKQAYTANGELDRSYLSAKVFTDQEHIGTLNSIVHPAVAEDYSNWAQSHKSADYVINEAALMVESGSYKSLDKLITVAAPVDLRIQRVLKRDPQRGEDQIRQIINKQISEKERQKVADFVIVNDDVKMLIPQVLALHNSFTQKL